MKNENELDSLLSEFEEYESVGIELDLIRSKEGNIKNLLTNIEIIIQNFYWFDDLGFDDFTQEVTIKRVPINDTDINNIRLTIDNNYEVKFPKDDIIGVLESLAHRNTYHPIKEMIESKAWDGVPRVETLFADYLGAENNDYIRTITRKWLTGGIARVYNPGVKFELVPILQGTQGRGKSALSGKLGGKYFTDSLKGMGKSKDDYQQLIGAWVVEIAELASMKSTEVELMKNFISAMEDKVRLPYERVPRHFKRTCIFIGTTNDTEYLIDLTGNRRFFPIPLKNEPKYNWSELTDELRQQVWAEAKVIYDNGESLFLPKEMEEIAESYREEVMEKDLIHEQIQTFLDMDIPRNWDDMELWQKQSYFREWNEGYHITMKRQDGVPHTKTSKKEIMQVVFKVEAKDRNQMSIGKKVTLFMSNHPEWKSQSVKINKETVKGYKCISN